MGYDRKYRTTARGRASRGPPSARYAKKKVYKKYKYAPRYSGVRPPRRQAIKRRVVSALNDIAESHLISTKIVAVRPAPLQYNVKNAVVHYNLGSTTMTNVNSGMVTGANLNQFSMGTSTDLIGKFAYLKRNTHVFQIRMTPVNDATFSGDALGPIHFRVLILANRTRMNTLNVGPQEKCFLNFAGNTFGYDSDGVVDSLAIKSSLINKKDFVVLRDQQFLMSCPSFAVYKNLPGNTNDMTYSSAGGDSYPAVKMFKHITQVNKKCEYNNGISLGPPINLADDIYICIIAHSQSGVIATNWEVDLQNTLTYCDM